MYNRKLKVYLVSKRGLNSVQLAERFGISRSTAWGYINEFKNGILPLPKDKIKELENFIVSKLKDIEDRRRCIIDYWRKNAKDYVTIDNLIVEDLEINDHYKEADSVLKELTEIRLTLKQRLSII